MEYKINMQTVVETPSYLKAAEAIFTPAERQDIVAMIAADPECDEVMQGTGGFRKVRVGRGGMGKRGVRESCTSSAMKRFRSSSLPHIRRMRRTT